MRRIILVSMLAALCGVGLLIDVCSPAAAAAATGPGGKPAPDLTITASSVTPQPLGPSQPFQICVTVKNIGPAASTPFQIAATAYGGSPAPARSLNGLAPGASAQPCLGYAVGPASGTQSFTVTADSLHVMTETDETNNTANVAVTVTPPIQPDLAITGTSLSPQSLSPGQSFSACATVKNIGQAAAGQFQVVGSPLSGSGAPSQTLNGLAVGASTQACLNYPAAPSSAAFLTLTADALNAVSESNEANNSASLGVTSSSARPDLVIGGIAQQPNPASPGQGVQICLTIQNVGAGGAGGFRVSGGGIGSGPAPYQTVASLNAGGSTQVCLNYPAAPAAATWLTFTADSLGAVSEVVETNNTANAPITVAAAKPDLTISTYWIEDPTSHAHITSVAVGHSVLACAVIKNQGQGPAGSFGVYGSFWGGSMYSQTISGLSPGSSGQLCFNGPPATASNGGLSVGWIIDSNNQVQETNEGNNSESLFLQVH